MANPQQTQAKNQSRAVGRECSGCQDLFQLIASLQNQLIRIEERLTVVTDNHLPTPSSRKYYGVTEFAKLVNKSEYTVREWCRLYRINAEKCESGHGEYKSWKIPADELARYRDHGLLPLPSKY